MKLFFYGLGQLGSKIHVKNPLALVAGIWAIALILCMIIK